MTLPPPQHAPDQHMLPQERPAGLPQVPPVPPRNNSLALVALILGIIPLTSFLAVVLGLVSLIQIKLRGGQGKGMAIAGIALGSFWLALGAGGVIYDSLNEADRDNTGVTVSKSGAPVRSVKVGDCVSGITQRSKVRDITVVSCTRTHVGEVFAEFKLSDGSFPGEKAIQDQAFEGCESRFAEYASARYEQEQMFVYAIYPEETAWNSGNHTITCIAGLDGGATLSESIKG